MSLGRKKVAASFQYCSGLLKRSSYPFRLLVPLTAVLFAFQNCAKTEFRKAVLSEVPAEVVSETTEMECGQQIIDNGSFEFTDSRRGQARGQELSDLSGAKIWDIYSALPGSADDSWYLESGAGIEVQGPDVTTLAADGALVVELDSTDNSKMSQDINVVGGSYLLQFQYYGRTAVANSNTIHVYVNDVLVHSVQNGDKKWSAVSIQIDLSPGSNKISFEAGGVEDQFGGLIDDVELQPVGC